MSIFCSRIQVRIPHCIQSSGHLKNFSLWFVRISQSFLIFHHLDSFEEYLSCILQNLLQFGFVSFFYDYTWVMGFWKEYHKGEVPFSSCVRKSCYQHDLITGDVDLYHLTKSLFYSRSFTFHIQIQYLFLVIFCVRYEVQVKDFFGFFACRCSVVPTPFVENSFLSPLTYLCIFVENHLAIFAQVYVWMLLVSVVL